MTKNIQTSFTQIGLVNSIVVTVLLLASLVSFMAVPLEVAAQSATPSTPDLHSDFDTGASNTDNLTRNTRPRITISGVAGGASVTVTARKSGSTDVIATGTVGSSATSIDLRIGTLTGGDWSITATQTETGNTISPASVALTITIDSVRPTLTVTNPVSQTTDATSRVFSAVDDDPEPTTTMIVILKETAQQCGDTSSTDWEDSPIIYTEGSNVTVTDAANNGFFVCFWTVDLAGNLHIVASDQIQRLTGTDPSPDAPNVPDLDESSDTGSSNSDNITNRTYLEFSHSGLTPGATPRLTATKVGSPSTPPIVIGVRIGAVRSTTASQTIRPSDDLTDGTWSITASQKLRNRGYSAPSAPITLIVDRTAPTVTVSNPSQTGPAASRTFSATDDESSTVMKVKLQTGSSCASTVPNDAQDYTEGSDYVVSGTANNNKYVCFWSTDVAGNVGYRVSAQIQNIAMSATPNTPDLKASSDTGDSSDDTTSNVTPTVTVTGVVAGAAVVVTATKSGSPNVVARENASGSTVDVTLGTLTDGMWFITAVQTEPNKEVSSASAALSVIIDTAAPTITVSNPSQTGTAASRTFSATDNDGGTTVMKVRLQTGSSCANTVPGDAQTYTEGSNHVVTDTANNGKYLCFWSTDAVGNVGNRRSDQVQNIAMSATPSTPDLKVDSDTGTNTADDVTNDLTPTITVSGIASGASVTITATKQGETARTGDRTGDGDITLPTLTEGTWSITAIQTEVNKAPSRASAALSVIIDTTAPTITVTNPGSQAADAASRTFSATDNDAGATVMKTKIQTGSTCANTVPGDAQAYTEGSDTVITGSTNNNQYVCFWSTDVAGNVGNRRSNQIQRLLDTSALPGTPDLKETSDTGASTTDDITNDTTPTITVGGVVSGADVTVTATKSGESNVFATGTVGGGATAVDITLGTLTAGVWSITATQTETGELPSGASPALPITIDIVAPTVTVTNPTSQAINAASRTFSATDNDNSATMKVKTQTGTSCANTVPSDAIDYTEGSDHVVTTAANNNKYVCFWSTDVAGNVGHGRGAQIQNIVDGGISATPGTPDLKADSDSADATDNITSDTTPTITVGGIVNGASVTVTAAKQGESNVIATGTAAGTTIDLTLGTLAAGTWSITAMQTESDGIPSIPSSALPITIDTTAPTITITNPASQSSGAASRTFSATDNDAGTTTMKVRLQTGNSCTNTIPNDAQDYTEGNDYVVTGSTNNSKYSCFWSTDVAGNVGHRVSARTQNILDMSLAPATPDLMVSSDTGTNDMDNITNDTTPTITVGSAMSGASVTVTATKSGATNVVATGTVGSSATSVDLTLGTLTAGVWSITATQTETGKAASVATSALEITVDTTAPANFQVTDTEEGKKKVTITTTVDNERAENMHLAFTGTCSQFGDENGRSEQVTATAGTGETYTFSVRAPKGSYAGCTVKAVDGAGNEGTIYTIIDAIRVRGSGSSGKSASGRSLFAPSVTRLGTQAQANEVRSRVETVTTKKLTIAAAPVYKQGEKNESIKMAQKALNETSCAVGSETGYFGTKTDSAVRCYQATKGIPASGELDVKTRLTLQVDYIKTRIVRALRNRGVNPTTFLRNAGLNPSSFGL